MRDVKQISGALCSEHLTGAFPEVSVNDNYSALWHVREKMSEKYILSQPRLSLSRQAFYGAADGVSLREYKCQTRLI